MLYVGIRKPIYHLASPDPKLFKTYIKQLQTEKKQNLPKIRLSCDQIKELLFFLKSKEEHGSARIEFTLL